MKGLKLWSSAGLLIVINPASAVDNGWYARTSPILSSHASLASVRSRTDGVSRWNIVVVGSLLRGIFVVVFYDHLDLVSILIYPSRRHRLLISLMQTRDRAWRWHYDRSYCTYVYGELSGRGYQIVLVE